MCFEDISAELDEKGRIGARDERKKSSHVRTKDAMQVAGQRDSFNESNSESDIEYRQAVDFGNPAAKQTRRTHLT